MKEGTFFSRLAQSSDKQLMKSVLVWNIKNSPAKTPEGAL